MGFYTATATDILSLWFKASAIANIADNAASSPETNIHCALHTADPGAAGTLSTSEATYTSYARQNVGRSGSGFTVSSNVANPAADITFPAGTGGSGTLSYVSFGKTGGGTAKGYLSGALSPTVVSGNGVQPIVKSTTTITLT